MAIIKPFKGLRPPKNIATEVACLPYDVMNTAEALKMAEGKKASLLHITRAEIDLDKSIDIHDEKVYAKAKENFNAFQKNGFLKQDTENHYYIYAQTIKLANQALYSLILS